MENKISQLRETYQTLKNAMGDTDKVKIAFVNSLTDIILKYNPIADRARFICLDDKERECLEWLVAAKTLKSELS